MPDKSRHLSEQQLKAIDLLLLGKTDAEVAKEVGVTRQTVNEWKNKNDLFIVELNRRREALRDAVRERLLNIAYKAVDTVEKEIENGNWKLAMDLLKALDLPKIEIGYTSIKAMEEDRKWQELVKIDV